MSSRLTVLVKGELQRLNKYNVFSISILVAFVWGIVLFLVNDDLLVNMLPMVLLLDATMMSMMYIGSVMHFEKTESTISTMLVTPTTNSELVASKVIANIIHNIISSLLIIIAFWLFKGEDFAFNVFLMISAVIISTVFFTIAGLCLAYYQKDFTGMLVNIMIIAFGLVIPSLLFLFGILSGDGWEYGLMLNPFQAAQEIIRGSAEGYEFTYKYFFSLAYLSLGSVLLYIYFAIPKFQAYAVKQSGV